MRIRQFLLLACAAGAANAFAQQALVCPPGSAVGAKTCELFHYHIQLFRPETRRFFEVTGVNDFASNTACERFRDDHIRRNLAVVDYLKRVKGDEKYEPDRFGPCHCDMTRDKTNAAYLSESQRQLQIRTAEDIRLRVRERLLDTGMTSDSEVVRGLIAQPPTLPAIGGPRLVPLPPVVSASTTISSPDDLRATVVDTRPPTPAALDLPLVDVDLAGRPQPPPAPAASTAPSAPTVADQTAAQQATRPVQETSVAAPEADSSNAESAVEGFIGYETERMQALLKAASAISDETVKSKIFEASLQRTQLLSNMRTLIEGSGAKSRLAAAVRSAQNEKDHLALAQKLFGDSMSRHWAPKDAADVVLPAQPDIDAEPEQVLRDSTGRYDEQQKKRALYDLLARSQPTEAQQLWLVDVIDTLLR